MNISHALLATAPTQQFQSHYTGQYVKLNRAVNRSTLYIIWNLYTCLFSRRLHPIPTTLKPQICIMLTIMVSVSDYSNPCCNNTGQVSFIVEQDSLVWIIISIFFYWSFHNCLIISPHQGNSLFPSCFRQVAELLAWWPISATSLTKYQEIGLRRWLTVIYL